MKKIFSGLFISVLIFISTCLFVCAQNVAGDVDADGFVRAADARIVLRAAVGLEELHKEQKTVADVDNNYVINSADARLILRAAVGLEVLHIHAYRTEIIIKEASCVADGQKRYVCTCKEYKDEIIPATGHNFTDTVVMPTCTQKGYTKHSCIDCPYTFTENYTKAKGHSYSSAVILATCTEKGYTLYSCSDCSYSFTGDYTTAKGHSYKSTEKLPTCTENGERTYLCLCGASFCEDIPALGHSFDGIECSVCSEPNPDYIPPRHYASVKGSVTFEYDGAATGDQGARVLLVPMNSSVKNYDNSLAASLVPGDYESGVNVGICDSSGHFRFSTDVRVGKYLFVAVSANSNSEFRLTDTDGWNAYVDNLLDEYFSLNEINSFKTICSCNRIFAEKIEVAADSENIIDISFAATDF